MPFLHGFAVTVTRYSRNGDGDLVVGTSFTLNGCVAGSATRRTYETDTYDQDTLRAELLLYVPNGSGVLPTDRITFPDGTVWEVWGYPVDFASPFTSWAPGGQVQLRRFTG